MDKFFFALTQKLAIAFVMLLPVIGHGLVALTAKNFGSSAQPATAIIATNFGLSPASSTLATANTTDLTSLPVVPDLLPSSTIPFCASTSTCGRKNISALIKLSKVTMVKIMAAFALKTATTTKSIITTIIPTQKPTAVAAAPTPAPTPITAQALVAAATPQFKKLLSGGYNVALQATVDGQTVSWDIDAATVDGSTLLPFSPSIAFAAGFSCDPSPQQPDISNPDQHPIFAVATSYQCQISLTPTSGDDQRTQSITISFTTPSGQLIVTPSNAMNTLLVNDTNYGGFVLDNQNSAPVTIAGATFNFSYTGVVANNQPLVFRILDPVTNQSLFDYHLENGAPTSSVAATFSLTIPAGAEEMLPVEILGVQKIFVAGTTPTVSAQIQNLATSDSVATTLAGATISWSCEVPLGGYDPNATSGPYADGRACGQ